MTPKEKALDLIDKFEDKLIDADAYFVECGAKKCALIAVDEIMKCTKYENQKFENDRFSEKYWQEVKQEIEKL